MVGKRLQTRGGVGEGAGTSPPPGPRRHARQEDKVRESGEWAEPRAGQTHQVDPGAAVLTHRTLLRGFTAGRLKEEGGAARRFVTDERAAINKRLLLETLKQSANNSLLKLLELL